MNCAIKFLALLTGASLSLGGLSAYYASDGQPAPGEDYIINVLMGELPYTFEPEAMRAQAVAARSYLLYCAETGQSGSTAYITYDELCERWGQEYADRAYAAAKAAAYDTAGYVLVWEDEPALAVWHSSSRVTESSADVWGGDLEYLRPVESFEDADAIESAVELTLADAKSRLAEYGYDYDLSDSVAMTLDKSGRCETLTVGNVTLPGTEARWVFGLRSTDFTVKISDGKLCFRVWGYGHGVGMSQLGANELAKAGYDWRQILAHYYPGCEIAVE